jgi:hypothetical protein
MRKTLPFSFSPFEKGKKIDHHLSSQPGKNPASYNLKQNVLSVFAVLITIIGPALPLRSEITFNEKRPANIDLSYSASNDPGKLNREVKFPQTISFSAMDVVYGVPDFAPQATSSSGLPLTFTSSDPAIASVENGKIHIKKAGRSPLPPARKVMKSMKLPSPLLDY